MVFSSMLFVFFFLTLNLLSQILLKEAREKNVAMLIFSLIFYSWAGPKYLILLVGMTFICWIGAMLIESRRERAKIFLIITVVLCLTILGVFKYTGFFLGTFQAIFKVPEIIPEIALPVGISFYTFQLLSYVIDVYRGEVYPQRKFWMLLLYSSLFHQCIAGPIVRYKDIHSDLLRREPSKSGISAGISRFSVGLIKKAVLANGCAAIADTLLVMDKAQMKGTPSLGILMGVLAFTLQIYLDFSAYSDMAIGMGLMCGLHYKENFNYPYIASSITEFWRRWHISLSTFFRDYVYIPLGGNRLGEKRQIINLIIVWGLTGLWHGASWNFVLWGLYYCLLLCLERFVFAEKLERLPRAVKHVLVILLVMFGWSIFKFTDVSLVFRSLIGVFGLNGNGFYSSAVGLQFKNNAILLLVSIIACTPLIKKGKEWILENYEKNVILFWVYSIWDILHPVLFLVVSAMALVGDSYNPFIYFRF